MNAYQVIMAPYSCSKVVLFTSLLGIGCSDWEDGTGAPRCGRVAHGAADSEIAEDPVNSSPGNQEIGNVEANLEAEFRIPDPITTVLGGAPAHEALWLAGEVEIESSESAIAEITSLAAASLEGVVSTETGAEELPGDQLFASDQVIEVHVSLADSQWKDLEEHGHLEQYVPAAVSVIGSNGMPAQFETVGFRHKGAGTLSYCWDALGVRSYAELCRKISYKLKFSEFHTKSRLDGLKRLNLHAQARDQTKLRELLALSTFREFGVDAPRAVPAKLYINDQFQGLFIAVEEVDGRYAKAHYPEGADGNLYKEIWPRHEYADVTFAAALETNEEVANVTDMRQFAQSIASATVSSFASDVGEWIDANALIRYLAVDRAIKNFDGITAFYYRYTPHNFFWYHDSSAQGRFHLIPWDLEHTFWPFDPYMHPQDWVTALPIPDLNSKPLNCEQRPIWTADNPGGVVPPRCDPLFDLLIRTHWDNLVEVGRELLQGPMSLPRMLKKVNHWEAQLEPIVAQDPTLDLASWKADVASFAAVLETVIRDFEAFLAEGLIEEQTLASEPGAAN